MDVSVYASGMLEPEPGPGVPSMPAPGLATLQLAFHPAMSRECHLTRAWE